MNFSGNLDHTKIYINGNLDCEKNDWNINDNSEINLVFKLFATSSDYPFVSTTFDGIAS